MDLEQEILRQLKARQEELQVGVFSHPPKDYPEFCLRLGEWSANRDTQEHILALIRSTHERDL